jgi:hypothetical protein
MDSHVRDDGRICLFIDSGVGRSAVKQISALGLVLATILGACVVGHAQDETVRLLEPQAARRFLPDRVPMETDMIGVDAGTCAVLQFPDKTRLGLAVLVTASLTADMKKKYEYALVSETRVKLGRWTLPAGMVGLSLQGVAQAPVRTLVARDFNGAEIERITLQLDASAPEAPIALKPTGTREFTLYIGKYAIQGSQR